MSKSKTVWASLLLGVLATAACEPGYAIWVIAGSTAEHLVFGLATERDGHKTNPLWIIEVDECNRIAPDLRESPGRVMWRSQANGPGFGSVPRAVYGVSTPGMRDSVRARPLTPGCYNTWVAA